MKRPIIEETELKEKHRMATIWQQVEDGVAEQAIHARTWDGGDNKPLVELKQGNESILLNGETLRDLAKLMDTPKDPLPLPPVPCSALDEQRNALAEARLRIIARYEHVETWLKQPATEQTLANWAGMVEGLRQARQIIGVMWDELSVPKPQAVIDHEAHMRRVIEEQNNQLADKRS